MIKTTGQAEIERVQNRPKPTWGLFSSMSIVEAVHIAIKLGWAEKKVQVRYERYYDDAGTYIVEPFEKDCGCQGILRYADYAPEQESSER